MNDQDITVIITSFHSGEKIFNCIESINKDVKIIVVENSNDQELKEKIQCLPKEIQKKDLSQKICKQTKANKDDRSFLLPSNKLIITKHKRSSAE